MNASYGSQTGTTPSMKLRRILKPGEAWIVEGTMGYSDGIPVSVVSIIEMGPDGKMSRQTDYFANPFEAPASRSGTPRRWSPPARADAPQEPVALGARGAGGCSRVPWLDATRRRPRSYAAAQEGQAEALESEA